MTIPISYYTTLWLGSRMTTPAVNRLEKSLILWTSVRRSCTRSGQSAGTPQKTYGEKIRWTKQQSKSNAKKGGLVRWGKS